MTFSQGGAIVERLKTVVKSTGKRKKGTVHAQVLKVPRTSSELPVIVDLEPEDAVQSSMLFGITCITRI